MVPHDDTGTDGISAVHNVQVRVFPFVSVRVAAVRNYAIVLDVVHLLTGFLSSSGYVGGVRVSADVEIAV